MAGASPSRARPGSGSTFVDDAARTPRRGLARWRGGHARGRLGARRLDGVSARLLLVEDEPGLVMTLTDRLIAEGYDVETRGRRRERR